MKMENKNQFTVIHRILHWSVALLMSILFITGFLRMYWMSKKTIIDTVETEMQSHNISLEKGQIIPIVKSIQKPMWEWHEYAAYIMFLAFLVRIIYMLVKGIKFPDPLKKSQSVKERMQGFIYVIFYLFIAVSIVTGFYLKWGDGQWKEPMEAVHKWAIYWFPIFILLHFGGIVIGELTNKKGIVSKMIGGE
ncbi:cytochrome b/b6 domain-containing protein [Pedobacter suwonensis]|uniref:cytochrome b/b6 domain-containing protein n=2 Tax=Bacteroidota/Chlorobiota group TaxID=68336 RepID=UPI000B51A11C|nr:cytochrome b/b6 domain-containing protein [Chryseobacterium indologenes]